MAILRMNDIVKIDKKTLDEKVMDLRIELAKEKANIRIGASVTSPGRLREIKKTIARVETFRNQKLPEASPKEGEKK